MYKMIDALKANCKYYTHIIVLVIQHWNKKYTEV